MSDADLEMQEVMDGLLEEKIYLRSQLDAAWIKINSLERVVAKLMTKLKICNQKLKERSTSD